MKIPVGIKLINIALLDFFFFFLLTVEIKIEALIFQSYFQTVYCDFKYFRILFKIDNFTDQIIVNHVNELKKNMKRKLSRSLT